MKKSMSEKIAVRLVAVGLVAMALTTLLCMVMFHSVFEKQVVRDLQLTAKDIALACERMEDPEDLGSFGGGELRTVSYTHLFRFHSQRTGNAKTLLLSAGKPQRALFQAVFYFVPQRRAAQRLFYDLVQLCSAGMTVQAGSVGAVSYTHLDVYKRQGFHGGRAVSGK